MLVLGLNGVDGSFHDSSASLFADGELVFSIEEERLNRIKHTSGIPVTAVQECLARVGASIGDVDAIGFYLNPQSMFKNYFMRTVRNYWPRTFNLYRSRSSFQQLLSFDSVLRQRLSVGCRTDSYYFNHHLCHAASAFHFSQFDEAAILIIDGSGDDETASLFVGNSSGRITKKATFSRYPQSLGLFYSSIADNAE